MKLIVNLILVSFITYIILHGKWGTSPRSRPCYVHHDDGDLLILIIFIVADRVVSLMDVKK